MNITPRSTIKGKLRQMWVRSRERAEALKRDDYTCQKCRRKQSKAKGKEFKVEVHHIDGVKWDKIITFIYKELLVDPEKLKTLCPECHRFGLIDCELREEEKKEDIYVKG